MNRSTSKSVLIIGETGAGKSTFINTITNYFNNGNLDELKVAIPTKHLQSTEGYVHTEINREDSTSSKTSACTTYSFKKDSFEYKFIDTPGLNDTRNHQQDEHNLRKILETAQNTKDLAAVLLIINSTQGRMTPALENVFTMFKGNIPDRALNNLIIILNHAERKHSAFQRSTLANIAPNIQKESILYMNNTAFVARPQNGRIVRTLQLDSEWRKSMTTCDKIVSLVRQLDYVPVRDFRDVVGHRNRIRELLQKVKLELKKHKNLLAKLEAAQSRERNLATDEAEFTSYTQQGVQMVKSLQKTPYLNLLCRKCDHLCKLNCSQEEIDSFYRNDSVALSAICGLCPNKCSYEDHYLTHHIFVEEEKTMANMLTDMKDQYHKMIEEREKITLQINNYTNAKNAIEKTMQTIVDSLNHNCNRLKQLCSGFNFADELRVVYNQLTMEAKKERTMARQSAVLSSLEVLKQMMEFHAGECSCFTDAQFLRPDLDDSDYSDSDDGKDDTKKNAVQKRTGAFSKLPSKTKPLNNAVAGKASEVSDDDWEAIAATIFPATVKTTKTTNKGPMDKSSTKTSTPAYPREKAGHNVSDQHRNDTTRPHAPSRNQFSQPNANGRSGSTPASPRTPVSPHDPASPRSPRMSGSEPQTHSSRNKGRTSMAERPMGTTISPLMESKQQSNSPQYILTAAAVILALIVLFLPAPKPEDV